MRLVWDQVGERRYETGVDRGVLYLKDNTGVAWNGLTSVDDNENGSDVSSYYIDGIKYFDSRPTGDFAGAIKAFTYPDEFAPFDGYGDVDHGITLANQPVNDRFGLSYRTKIGNDVDGLDHGYKVHILYNLVAKPDTRSYPTVQDSASAMEFSWSITGVPEMIIGFKPTVHIILDSRNISSNLLSIIEDSLYGTDTNPPTLLPMQDIINMTNAYNIITITDNGDGTWTAEGPDELVVVFDDGHFVISDADVVYLDADTYEISSTHE